MLFSAINFVNPMSETHIDESCTFAWLKNVNNEPDITAMTAEIQQQTPHELRMQ
jgi:hypothetical protein